MTSIANASPKETEMTRCTRSSCSSSPSTSRALPAVAGLAVLLATITFSLVTASTAEAQLLPFQHTLETYRAEEGDVTVFALRLEQPFLAEEFEKSNYLRLEPLDHAAFLIYPKQTRFSQKHAEFYGRLRGDQSAKVRLSYETVSEEQDGSRRIDVRTTEIEIKNPTVATGPTSLYRDWARRQNEHFARLLQHYPDESFFEYALLQSADRYGVKPPTFSRPAASRDEIEEDLYRAFSGGLTVQQALQRRALDSEAAAGNLDIHISTLTPPSLRTLPFDAMLKRSLEVGEKTHVHAIAKLVPADQYFVHFGSVHALNELFSLAGDWGNELLRVFTVRATEHHLRDKFQEQLCLQTDGLSKLFEAGVVAELAMTGADTFIAEGTDLTILLRLDDPDLFLSAANGWLADASARHPELVVRDFHYRGHQVQARYTEDRIVSSFVINVGEYAIYSSSHRAIRRVIDTLVGQSDSLLDAPDYRYVTTVLPPGEDEHAAYLFASDAFLRRITSPAWKISEKRRMQCFNNLVMLNNASLFYRLETGGSPNSLSDLVEGRFVDPKKLVCPHGGAYAIDAERDTCTCSLHNRLKYLTPNIELSVLQISKEESQEYARYKKRHEGLWGRFFNPVAARIDVQERVRFEVAVMPFANSGLYEDIKDRLSEISMPLDLGDAARSAIVSLSFLPGRDSIRDMLREIPGVHGLIEADPTLTDLSWIGDRVGVHLCDGETILEIDPTRLRDLKLFIPASTAQQIAAAAAISATNLPLYVTVEVEDEEKAARLLRALPSRMFLERWETFDLPSRCDAYRLPDYRGHEVYVLSYQLYALKVRLHVALVGNKIVAATRPLTLEQVIDAKIAKTGGTPRDSQLIVRLNRRAIDCMEGDLRVYWAEKAREACHRNIMSIYNLVTLYETPVEEIDRLSDAKYGVTYFCPDGGAYSFSAQEDRVSCSLHGNRLDARQGDADVEEASFGRFMNRLEEILATLRFEEDAMIATLEIARDGER